MWKPFLIFSSQNIERMHLKKIALLALQYVFEPDFQLHDHWALQYNNPYIDKIMNALYSMTKSYCQLRKPTSSAYDISFYFLPPPLYF